MKKSLKLLGVESSGVKDFGTQLYLKKTDEQLISEVNEISDVLEKESYLKKYLEKKPSGFVKSKRLLAQHLKTKDPQFACELIMSACQAAPLDPYNYFSFAQIAIEDQALLVAKGALETVIWLSLANHKDITEQANSLFKVILEKITNNEIDNSKNDFWRGKSLDKYWILERLYFQCKLQEVIDYSFRLLNKFPGELENYDIVCKALSYVADPKAINKLIEHIKVALNHNVVNQNLYLGICYHHLLDFDASVDYLGQVIKKEPLNSKALFYLALSYLLDSNLKDFVITCNKIIPSSDPSYAALYFIYCALCDFQLDKKEFPNQKNISREVGSILDRVLLNNHLDVVLSLTKQFEKLEYYVILPYLPLYLAELFIKNKMLDRSKEILKLSNDFEVHRLLSWIYRIEGKEDLAEEELIKYRKTFIPNQEAGLHCKLVSLDMPQVVPDDVEQIFKIVDEAYKKTKVLIKEIDLEYGLNAMTCIETGCQDCCTKTFPYISYTEYIYMKKWLDKQPEEFKNQIYQQSIQIVNSYREEYHKDPPFLCGENLDLNKDYPIDFTFRCPYLGDNKCNVYEARPFTCRAFGYGSVDGRRYKGCNYFFEQLKGATKLNDIRKVVDMASFYKFAKLTDEKLIGKNVIAPIPVWFAQKHEETLEKVKKIMRMYH